MNNVRALHGFWSSFGWKAYDESTVPSEDLHPVIPRITYEVATDEFDAPVSLTASLWDRSYSWENISNKATEIYNYIGRGGRMVRFEDNVIWVKRGSPFSQRMSDEDDSVRRIVLNIEVEYSTS